MWDITRRLYPGHPVWPGDTPFTYELTWKMAEGASVNVGKIESTTHLGTHLDAPYHYDPAGERLEAISLSVLVGPCRVVDAQGQAALDEPFLRTLGDLPERVLFYTGQPGRWKTFPETFTHVTPAAAAYLASRGVKLFGIDCPSVDPLDSKTLEAHHAFRRGQIYILEGLALEGVQPGTYELICLPLALEGADASPVRAILR